MIINSNSLLRGSGMPYQVHDALRHAMSGTELSRVRTELRPLPPPSLSTKDRSRREGPTLLCNQVELLPNCPSFRKNHKGWLQFRLADYPSTCVRAAVSQAPHVQERLYSKEGLWVACSKDYSYLNATIGSTRIARRAGTKPAMAATIASATETTAMVSGSIGESSKSWLAIMRVAASASGMPMPI